MKITRRLLLIVVVLASHLGAGLITTNGGSWWQIVTMYCLPFLAIGAYVFVNKIYSSKSYERIYGSILGFITISFIIVNFTVILLPLNKCALEDLSGTSGYEDCNTTLRTTYVAVAALALATSVGMSYKTERSDKK